MQLFISYSSRDRDFARELAEHLEKQGISVFYDKHISPGDEWPSFLRKKIEESSALVLLVPSPDSPHRNTLWFEAGAAKALGKRVLAVLPPGRSTKELPINVADIIVLDTDQRPLEGIAATLAQAAGLAAESTRS
jgi:hypothetical protein